MTCNECALQERDDDPVKLAYDECLVKLDYLLVVNIHLDISVNVQ